RRRATPMRQAIDLLESQPFMTTALAPYFRDVLDHLMRIGEMVDAIRDLIMTLLDVRTTQAANRMNEVMKSLTAWATILLVPTLFAGIWGMNFRHMPELDWRYGYQVAIMTIVGSAFGLYAWFKWKKRWL
ncbi:MAG TPA: CorA family divalent cation transporter, partial [Actinomycetota bacterium]